MFENDLPLLLLFIGFGALIQTITGFAMGLIIIGGVTLFGVADITFTAMLISLISMLNTLLALRHSYRSINWKYVRNVSLTMIPALVFGVWILDFLSSTSYQVLRKLLGVVIVLGGVLLVLKPKPYNQTPSTIWLWLVGSMGGVIAGLFSAGGAPLAYYMYRQPMEISVIRSTLLAFFTLTTLSRSVVVAVNGQLNTEVLKVTLLAIPVVMVVTISTSRILHLLPDGQIRRLVFALLILMGMLLIIR